MFKRLRRARDQRLQVVLNWKCSRCDTFVEPVYMRCGCSFGPSPWERQLDELPGYEELVASMEAEAESLEASNEFAPTREELREENELLTEMVQDYATTVAAARHLLQVMIQASAAGKPLFAINDEELDLQSRRMLRHAIISLEATLEGTEPPAIALEINPTEIN